SHPPPKRSPLARPFRPPGQRIRRGAFEPASDYAKIASAPMSVTSRLADWPSLGLEDPGAGELSWPLDWGAEKKEVDWNSEMRRHGQRVVVSLLARGLRPARAKELAQEAWMRVIERHREGRLAELKLPGVVITQANFLVLDER